MNINEFVPFKISEDIDNSIPFVALSDTYPNDKFEPWTKENWEEMKKGVNSEMPIIAFPNYKNHSLV